eukprot:GILI01018694.1.p1 GENE.GILI01018694.1~~GILI01018694.1.p1  ORF type:complete len:610 (+),score=73.31 GILI01018694.1:88-1917(+)
MTSSKLSIPSTLQTPLGTVTTAFCVSVGVIVLRNILSKLVDRNTCLDGIYVPTEDGARAPRKSRLGFASRRGKFAREVEAELPDYARAVTAMKQLMSDSGEVVSDQNGISSTDFESTARLMKAIMKGNLIAGNDLTRSNMNKVFIIHRSLGAASIPSALAMRFTIQYNLFAGTIANLGSTEQRELLNQILDKGELGSFILTEVGAGVVSGMIVETVALWQNGGSFKLHCPTETSIKSWICNGLTAKWGIVIAKLLLPDIAANQQQKKRPSEAFPGFLDFGPHAFLVDLSTLDSAGTLTRTLMGGRTSFNNLDVASLKFTNATIPSNSLLSSGLSSVNECDGTYQLVDAGKPFKFEIVAQRLLAGRICISGVSLSFLRNTISQVRGYNREVPFGKGKTQRLVEIPALSAILDEAEMVQAFLSAYVRIIESKYRNAKEINSKLAEDIALAKMVCIEAAIYYTNKLKGAIGSWSLSADSPFGGNIENLYAYKFAEGDTNILVQKVAKDVIVRSGLSFGNILRALFSPTLPSSSLASASLSLAWAVGFKTIGQSSEKKMRVWFGQHRLVKEVAWRHATETIRSRVLQKYPEFRGSAELAFFDSFSEILVRTQL